MVVPHTEIDTYLFSTLITTHTQINTTTELHTAIDSIALRDKRINKRAVNKTVHNTIAEHNATT